MADYTVWVADAFGQELTVIDYFHKLDYSRSINGVGVLNMTVPYSVDFRKDYRLGVWRKVGSKTYLDTDTVFLVRKVVKTRDSRGRRLVSVTAFSALILLEDRIVAYPAGSAESDKTNIAIDDMMKEVVKENLTTTTDPDRSIITYLSVDGFDGAGPVDSKAFAWRLVADVLAELSLLASKSGFPIYYDIVAVPPRNLVFKTYPLIRGKNLTGEDGLILSEAMGSLTDVVITEDYTNEKTFVYAGGQGEGDLRTIRTAEDGVSIGQSPFGRREVFVNATSSADVNTVQSAADSKLRASRSLFRFEATVLDNEQARYGIDWGLGDLVVANAGEDSFNCMVDNVRVSLSGGREVIAADLRVI